MTREEQIRQASIEYTINNAPKCIGGDTFSEVMDGMNRNHTFEEGAKWADKYPAINFWHDASEEPEEHSKIVIVDTKEEWWNIDYVSNNFDGYGLYGWDFAKVHYDIKIWAYADDLLPKGGKK